MDRPLYCPCEQETPDPCPACGATVSGNDKVRGICQARRFRPKRDVEVILTDRETGKEI